MARLFQRGSARSAEEEQPETDPRPSQAVSPTPDASLADAPASQPSVPASTEYPSHDRPGSTEHSAATALPLEAPADGNTRRMPAPSGDTSLKAAPDHRRPRWRGPLAVAAALAAAAVLIIGGLAIGRSTVGIGTSAGAVATVAVPPSAADLQQTVINVIHVVQPSVVEVTSRGSQGEAIGSGEILTADGYIVTNNHVVAGFSQYTVTLVTGQIIAAQLVGVAPQDDLAVLRIQLNHLRPISIGDSRAVQVGQFAIAMGSPLGLQQSATLGIVSAVDRQASEAQSGPLLVDLIQTSAPINPGNSGGALVDLQGRLIGIPTLGAENPESGTAANGIGFAIPSDRMKFVTNQLITYGHVVNTGQGFLGVEGLDVTPELASAYRLPVQSGVLIAGFAPAASGASPAELAGLQRGDIIVAALGRPITNVADLAAALLTQAPGTQVPVTVQRRSGKQIILVKLGERPAKQSG